MKNKTRHTFLKHLRFSESFSLEDAFKKIVDEYKIDVKDVYK